jgi:uncharacterized OB-fold protein
MPAKTPPKKAPAKGNPFAKGGAFSKTAAKGKTAQVVCPKCGAKFTP